MRIEPEFKRIVSNEKSDMVPFRWNKDNSNTSLGIADCFCWFRTESDWQLVELFMCTSFSSILAVESREDAGIFLVLATTGHYSLFPLVFTLAGRGRAEAHSHIHPFAHPISCQLVFFVLFSSNWKPLEPPSERATPWWLFNEHVLQSCPSKFSSCWCTWFTPSQLWGNFIGKILSSCHLIESFIWLLCNLI